MVAFSYQRLNNWIVWTDIMASYIYTEPGESISIGASVDDRQFGGLAIAMAAYSTTVMDVPRLDIFGIGVGGSILSEIVKVGNALFFGGLDKNVYCVSDEGRHLWKFRTSGQNVSPAVSNGRVFIGSFDENMYCLSTEGELLWKFETNGPIASKPCVAEGMVCFGSKDGNVYCLSEDGGLVWKFRTHGPITQDPVFHEGCIYIGSMMRSITLDLFTSGTNN